MTKCSLTGYQSHVRKSPKNRIVIEDLSQPYSVSKFYKSLRRKINNEELKEVEVYFDINKGSVYPNVLVPIVTAIEYYRRKKGISFKYGGIEESLERVNIEPQEYDNQPDIFGKIWTFACDSSAPTVIEKITKSYRAELMKKGECARGLPYSLDWALCEVMDNVIQHSMSDRGYIMGQLHSNGNLVFSITDYGRGILSSLKGSKHSPKTELDAITMAIKEGVTRDSKIGQGNGLFGLTSIVQAGKGRLFIASGGGSCFISPDKEPELKEGNEYINYDAKGTLIDFQIDRNSVVDLSDTSMFQYPCDLYVESFESEDGNYVYDIHSRSEGTATRIAGERARTEIKNLITEVSKRITLDFSNVAIMSSSYADECIVKLALELGLYQFNRFVLLEGMNDNLKNILNRSFRQRIESGEY